MRTSTVESFSCRHDLAVKTIRRRRIVKKPFSPTGFPGVSPFENASNIRSSGNKFRSRFCLICFDGIATEEGTQFAEVLLSVNHSQGYCQPAVSSPGNKGMNEVNNTNTVKFPLLEGILEMSNLPLKPMYTVHDVAAIFRVSTCSIQKWMSTWSPFFALDARPRQVSASGP